MNVIGYLDEEKYKCVSEHLTTNEVIITEERIQHIQERHPGDFERYVPYLEQIIEDPDYILEANKPNTAVLLKEFDGSGWKVILLAIKTLYCLFGISGKRLGEKH